MLAAFTVAQGVCLIILQSPCLLGCACAGNQNCLGTPQVKEPPSVLDTWAAWVVVLVRGVGGVGGVLFKRVRKYEICM